MKIVKSLKNFLLLFFLMLAEFCSAQLLNPTPNQAMPSYPGGEARMLEFIKSNMVYPDSAKANDVEGKVMIGFVVESTGMVRDVRINRSLSWDCDAEALRVVRLMPDWSPGYLDGKAVNVKYVLPITFRLKK